jgi:hypothetical protein
MTVQLNYPECGLPVQSLIFQWAIPVINAPTGTMANNGAITLGTALSTTYANCYLLLPAGAIATGVPAAAAILFCQMSSATVGTVFNNTYTSGVPTIPGAPVAFATTGPGAYTGVTGANNGPSISIPGNSFGPNGSMYYEATWQYNNSAGTKALTVTFGGSTIFNQSGTTSVCCAIKKNLQNRGITNAQVSSDTGGQPGTGVGEAGVPTLTLVDTTANQNLIVVFNQNTATDFTVLDRFFVNIFPG